MQIGPFTDLSETESGLVAIPIQWTSGGTGAVPALSTFRYHQRVVSVTRNSAGSYTIVFEDGVVGLVGVIGNVIQASPATGGLTVKPTVNNMQATTAPSLTVVVTVPAGAATDPASGDVVMLTRVVQYMDAIASL